MTFADWIFTPGNLRKLTELPKNTTFIEQGTGRVIPREETERRNAKIDRLADQIDKAAESK